MIQLWYELDLASHRQTVTSSQTYSLHVSLAKNFSNNYYHYKVVKKWILVICALIKITAASMVRFIVYHRLSYLNMKWFIILKSRFKHQSRVIPKTN